MRKYVVLFVLAVTSVLSMSLQAAGCPSFPSPAYNSLVYNLGCVPWDLEWSGSMSGDLTGAYFQWYRYKNGASSSTATPCDWQTDHTTHEGFKPATDELSSYYVYFCKVTTTSCPSGVNSAEFYVQVGPNGDACYTFNDATFTITSGGSYTSGQTVTITATTTAYGGDHVYTWYHNGEAMDTTLNRDRIDFVWGFNNPKLVIHNVTPEDGGTYSVMMQDGSECFMYTDPVRVLVDNPSCGPVPTLKVTKSEIAEDETTSTTLTDNTLAEGEIGTLVYMVKPEGSNPTATAPGTWSTDMPGLYQFKYVVENPDNESCFRESKVVEVRVEACGETPTVTPSAEVMPTNNQVTFTVPALGPNEKGSISFTSDNGQSGTVYPNTHPNFGHTCYNAGTYTYTYTVTNTKAAGCTRTATCTVLWYSCGWVTAKFNDYSFLNVSPVKVGATLKPTPSVPTQSGMIGVLTYRIDGGEWTEIPSSQYTGFVPTEPGTYEFKYVVKHSDPRVTDCYSEATRTIVVEPCGTAAQLSTNKTVLKVGETATLTYNSPASGETMKLTYTKDGGSAQPAATTPSPYTFAPTESGEYVFTYSITNSGCGTNSQSVTIEVYDCGPEASIIASQTMVKPNTPITLTLSDVGADETATLTVSKNGGAEQPITISASPLAFTPAEEGTYVITYAITHAYINCSRSARAEVQVIDCDPEVTISTDKTIVAVGEGVGILLSRTANSRETATLTLSKDGGAAQPIAISPSPVAFTPTAPGVYTVTYTLTDAILGCVTTDNTTFTVYDCGPEASVTATRNTIRTDDAITIKVSEPGDNESGTLTVSRNGGAAQPVTAGTWSASEEGTYVFTYTITHAYINCTRTSQVTVGVSNCGDPVTLSADKPVYTLGETVSFSLSRGPDANETPSFSISKDGGAPQPFAAIPSPFAFTPDAVGTYTAIYSLNNSVLGCETNGETTFSVYECGPEAQLLLDKSIIRLGESAQLTLSALGADETATLTYTVNGGAPSPITINPSPITFTPTELGVYVLTYTITHPYIDCSRSATAKLEVYDCGTPASVSADKTNYKFGESVQLTLSAVGPDETATLTYTVNGGTQSPITIDQSLITFTPTELGTYVFTYTVSHTKIDCETSNQVTIKVYDCGPEASITIPVTELKLLRSTTITLSDLGADETATLTYTVNGGTQSPITINPSPITFTPTELGVYVLTYTVTHPYIDCSRTATATLTVSEAELVFDDKNGTHVWSDPKNWWPAYNRLPNAADSAVVRKHCDVDVTDAVARDLIIDMTGGSALTIRPTGALTIRGKLLNCKAGDLLIQADANANGALVLGPLNENIPATVQFFARSADKNALYPTWQYMGYPMQQEVLISAAYPEALFYEWTNTANRYIGGNWQRVDSLAGKVTPFRGYCMTQDKEKTYALQGILNNPVRKDIAVPYNDQGLYPGFAFCANSWPAPIDISRMDPSDFGAADATVYIMNTGTYEQAIGQATVPALGNGASKGQYNTIPVHAASYMAGALTVIPPMQGFFVHTKTATTLTLDYAKAVYAPAMTKVSTTPTRAPQNHKSEIINHKSIETVLRINVSGFGAEDEVYLLTDPSFTEAFDNGWDGVKARSDKSAVSMAVETADGPMAVAAVPELEGTELSFDGGNHKTYTITITNNQSTITNNLYLHDKETDVYTELRDGATYTFKSGAAPRRFVITEQITNDQSQMTNDEPYKFIRDGVLYIRQGKRLYNGTGRLLRNE